MWKHGWKWFCHENRTKHDEILCNIYMFRLTYDICKGQNLDSWCSKPGAKVVAKWCSWGAISVSYLQKRMYDGDIMNDSILIVFVVLFYRCLSRIMKKTKHTMNILYLVRSPGQKQAEPGLAVGEFLNLCQNPNVRHQHPCVAKIV